MTPRLCGGALGGGSISGPVDAPQGGLKDRRGEGGQEAGQGRSGHWTVCAGNMRLNAYAEPSPASCASPGGFKAPQGELALEGGWRPYHVTGPPSLGGGEFKMTGFQGRKDC